MKTVILPQLAWYESANLEIAFPDSWQIELCHMAGHERPALSPALIEQAILDPIGSLPISEAARGSKEVVIVFDDMSRPTRTAALVPYVLDELERAGIADSQIRFICALGCHGALTRHDFVKKLGRDIVDRFPVYNHNAFGNCSLVGTTRFGIELHINTEFMRCDFKVALGSIVPHGFAGYGGGAKIVLPGLASFETVRALHLMSAGGSGSTTVDFSTMGCIADNRMRQNIDEAAAIAGLNFKIDALVNTWGETVSVYAGAPDAAFKMGLEEARRHYLTPRVRDCDVVITNTFAKANEGEGGVVTGLPSLRAEGGDLVLICNAPEGHVAHYLFGKWGSISPGESGLVLQLPDIVERLIVFNEYTDLTDADFFTPRDKVLVLGKWADVLEVLQDRHRGGAKVGIYSSAEIQYCEDGAGQRVASTSSPPA